MDVPSLVFTITTKKLPASYTEFSDGQFFEFSVWAKNSQTVSSLNSLFGESKEFSDGQFFEFFWQEGEKNEGEEKNRRIA